MSTFGNSNIEVNVEGPNSNIRTVRFTSPQLGGEISSISAYVASWQTSQTFAVAIYADNGGEPGVLLAHQSSVVSYSQTIGWVTVPISYTIKANTVYHLGMWGSAAYYSRWAVGESEQSNKRFVLGYPSWPTPFNSTNHEDRVYSIYATYTTPNPIDFSLASYTPPLGNVVDFTFGEVVVKDFLLGFGLSGKIGKKDAADPLGVNGIYQQRMTKSGKRTVKMKFYTPTNPRTAPQQANRDKFKSAVAAWSSLTSSEKLVYTTRAKKRNMFGWGLFIREYYQAN